MTKSIPAHARPEDDTDVQIAEAGQNSGSQDHQDQTDKPDEEDDPDGEDEEPRRSGSGLEPLDLFGSIDLTGEQDLDPGMLPVEIYNYAAEVGPKSGINTAAVGIGCLASIATAIPAGWRVQPKPKNPMWTEPPIIWPALTGDSGAKKTTALKFGAKPIFDLQKRWRQEFTEEMEEYKRAFAIWKEETDHLKARKREAAKKGERIREEAEPAPEMPIMKRCFVDDSTTERLVELCSENPSGIAIIKDELTELLGSLGRYQSGGGQADRAYLLKGYNGDPALVDRKGNAKPGEPKTPIVADPFSVSIMGGIQDEKIREYFKGNTGDGFLARFLIVQTRKLPESEEAPDPKYEETYSDIIETIVEKFKLLPDGQQTVVFSDEAAAVRRELKELTDAMDNLPGVSEGLKLHLNKWAGMHARLSMVFHFVNCALNNGQWPASKPISGESAKMAFRLLTEFFLPEQARVYNEVLSDGDKTLEEATWIADHILTHEIGAGEDTEMPDHKRKRLSVHDITRARKTLKSDHGTLDQAMRLLEMSAWVRPAAGFTRANFTKMKWVINPRAHEIFAERAKEVRAHREEVKAQIAESAKKVAKIRGRTKKAA